MSIRKRQISRATDKFIKEALQGGVYPNTDSISYKLYKWQLKHVPGTPSLILRPAVPHGKSSSSDYNQCMEEINQDIQDIFEETKDQANRILVNWDFNETQRQQLGHEISKLEARIDNFLLIAKDTDGYVEAFNDTFDSFEHVDTQLTTANVDLQNGYVVLPEAERNFEKIDLSGSIVSINNMYANLEGVNMDPPSNCLDDNVNTAWNYKVTAPSAQEVTIFIDVKFATTPANINQVSYTSHSPKQTIVEPFFSVDGSTWESLPQQKSKFVTNVATWNFSEVSASCIRFKLTKKEPDDILDNKYIYYFGCKNIGIFKVRFITEATLISKPFTTNRDRISRVALEVEHEIPSGCEIEYAIAPIVDGESESVFQSISAASDTTPLYPKVLDLSALDSAMPTIITPEQTLYGTPYRGINFYIVKELSQVPIDGSAKLYRGVHQWKRDHMFYIPDETTAISTWDYKPTLDDWSRLPRTRDSYVPPYLTNDPIQLTEKDITTAYVDIADSSGTILPLNISQLPDKTFSSNSHYTASDRGHYLLYTTCIYCDEIPSPVKATLSSSGCYVSVYLNRKELQPQNPRRENGYNLREITYELVSGWNTLQYVVYKCVNDTSSETTSPPSEPMYINLGIQDLLSLPLSKDAHYVRAEIYPLSETSLYNLQNNVLMYDNSQYAIAKTATGSDIVINHNPVRYSSYNTTSVDSRFTIKYAMQYKYATDVNKIKSLKLMAILNRGTYDTVSPKIMSYRIKAL
jgi:hypothetical protein